LVHFLKQRALKRRKNRIWEGGTVKAGWVKLRSSVRSSAKRKKREQNQEKRKMELTKGEPKSKLPTDGGEVLFPDKIWTAFQAAPLAQETRVRGERHSFWPNPKCKSSIVGKREWVKKFQAPKDPVGKRRRCIATLKADAVSAKRITPSLGAQKREPGGGEGIRELREAEHKLRSSLKFDSGDDGRYGI